ncbi:aspartic proteinase cdr1 [Nicotiana attenuata]|uniref:Aspartic proteinase cdr1 n=2 Tax=Nicotiana attenuata TaxID=49451 RepID=A0A1J6KMY0_NICAT|nr:aspartic proteinase cdr1 [Nicotiana attenuata]
MIHYESIKSPFYNPKLTLEDRVRKMNQRSEARISDLMVVVSNILKKDSVEVQIYPVYGAQFLIPLKNGTPPVPQILIMDTGSFLLWVHCGFTIGGEGSPAPLYHNADSSSYVEDVYCGTSMCDFLTLKGTCGVSRRCDYTLNYVTGKTEGHLASEVVTFQSKNESEETIKRLVFGCSSISRGVDRCSGVLGLGQRPVSLVSQQNYTGFSYCIGNISDVNYDSNALVLGDKPIIEEISTPIFMVLGKYYINLERISVGDKFLDIDPSILKRIDYQGGMFVDSGATSSYLPEIAFKKLKEEIKSVIGTSLKEVTKGPEQLCYYGNIDRDLQRFPKITLHFAENADMELTAENLFHKASNNHFCLSVKISEEERLPFSILGVWAQQYFYISFDFDSMRLSFSRIDCDFLFD